ncbi:hypothetical protein NXS19_005204 [Fusarium pseudograminearum]|nr:hypothetical protein NXS19_005204 [Fusarium pseudograminearum]
MQHSASPATLAAVSCPRRCFSNTASAVSLSRDAFSWCFSSSLIACSWPLPLGPARTALAEQARARCLLRASTLLMESPSTAQNSIRSDVRARDVELSGIVIMEASILLGNFVSDIISR